LFSTKELATGDLKRSLIFSFNRLCFRYGTRDTVIFSQPYHLLLQGGLCKVAAIGRLGGLAVCRFWKYPVARMFLVFFFKHYILFSRDQSDLQGRV
jgi:hypothetical protein